MTHGLGEAGLPSRSPALPGGLQGGIGAAACPYPPSAAAACGPAPSQPPPRPSAPGSGSLRGLRAGGAQSREQASYPWALLSLGSGAFPPPPPCPWLDSRSRLRRSCFSWDSQHPAERLRCSKAIGQRSLEEGSGIWGEPGISRSVSSLPCSPWEACSHSNGGREGLSQISMVFGVRRKSKWEGPVRGQN